MRGLFFLVNTTLVNFLEPQWQQQQLGLFAVYPLVVIFRGTLGVKLQQEKDNQNVLPTHIDTHMPK